MTRQRASRAAWMPLMRCFPATTQNSTFGSGAHPCLLQRSCGAGNGECRELLLKQEAAGTVVAADEAILASAGLGNDACQ